MCGQCVRAALSPDCPVFSCDGEDGEPCSDSHGAARAPHRRRLVLAGLVEPVATVHVGAEAAA